MKRESHRTVILFLKRSFVTLHLSKMIFFSIVQLRLLLN
jgi:hypothetical protein